MRCTNMIGTALITMLLAATSCDYDDGPDPGDPGDAVDFIRFTEHGMFREVFLDVVFQSGELAVDVLPGELTVNVPLLGPGSSTMFPIDDADAPYPNFALPVKQTKHNGIWDRRYWVQFAGGSWNTLSIEGGPEHKFRASSSPPSFYPKTQYFWCPTGRRCEDWLTAVHARSVRCFKYTLNGYERPVNPYDCYFYHPRMHWRVLGCNTCPVPAAQEELQPLAYPDE